MKRPGKQFHPGQGLIRLVLLALLAGPLALLLARASPADSVVTVPRPDPAVSLLAFGDLLAPVQGGQALLNLPAALSGLATLFSAQLDLDNLSNPARPALPATLQSQWPSLERLDFLSLICREKTQAQAALDALQVRATAIATTCQEPGAPYRINYIERNGLRIASLTARPPASPPELENLLQQVKAARREARVVIINLAWGSGQAGFPGPAEKALVQQLAAERVDLILGQRAGKAGPFEAVGRTFVAYSLGSSEAGQVLPLSLYVKLDERGVALAFPLPLFIEGNKLRLPQPEERLAALQAATAAGESNPELAQAALFWDGSNWRSAPLLAYRRDARPDGQVNLPDALTLDAPDLDQDFGGYTTGRVPGVTGSTGTIDQRLELKGGRLRVWRENPGGAGWQTVWETKPGWQVEQVDFADADNDGRPEVMFSLWKQDGPDDGGQPRSHPFIYGWRRGAFRPVWAGSALADPIREFTLADLDRDGNNELIVLEGSYNEARHSPARYVTAWRWNGWGFELLYRSPAGSYSGLVAPPGLPYAIFKPAAR